ncbi:MAG: GTPase Era [Clostridia bacterium]|jgi:GTP-binding protein Era
MSFRSGFVTLIGSPNTGKSTLLNAFADEKIAITSSRPQTTRNTIKAVVTTDDYQMIFIDTPGLHKPKTKLGKYMVNAAERTIGDVDVVLFLADAGFKEISGDELETIAHLKRVKAPVFLIINKIDLTKKENLLLKISKFKDLMDFKAIIPISALKKEGLNIIMDEILKFLPEGPRFFPEDTLTDQPEKLLVAEIIREKILYLTKDEVPHGAGIEILSFKQREDKDIINIEAEIYCEKDSHKGILIGKQGSMLKNIGAQARVDIEKLLGSKVFLKLWVKVKPDWRNSEGMLKTLGYK